MTGGANDGLQDELAYSLTLRGDMGKRLRIAIAGGALLLMAAAALLWHADGLAAAQAADTRRLVVVDLVTLRDDADGKRRSIFQRGAKMLVDVRIKDRRDADDGVEGSPDYERRYAVAIWVKDPDDGVIYDGTATTSMREIALAPSKRGSVRFEWNVPYGAPDGRYILYASVRYADDPGRVIHRFAQAFGVNERQTYIYTSKRGIEFGDVVKDETPTGSLIIARRNRDAGDLAWRVVDWPGDWLDLLEPAIDPDNPDQSVEVVNTGTLRFGVRSSALRGSFRDEVVVRSNAGDLRFGVSANINRRARGELERVRVQPKALDAGQDLRVEFRIANEGDATVDYRAVFTIQGPDGAIAYDSNRAGADALMRLAAGERSELLIFRWQVPYGAYGGEYRVGVELRNAHEFNTAAFDAIRVYDDDDAEIFKVREGARLAVSPSEWRFGTITQGDNAAPAVFNLSNRGSRKQVLQWEVASIPDWAEIAGASSGVGAGDLAVGVRAGIAPGIYAGALEIASNGGTALAPLSLAVRAGPTATATTIVRPSSTPTGTAVVAPTRTSTVVSTSMVTLTATQTPTVAPTHTATMVPTSTPTITATTTAVPTSTVVATQTPTVTPTSTPTARATATTSTVALTHPSTATALPTSTLTPKSTLTPTTTPALTPAPTSAPTPLPVVVSATSTPAPTLTPVATSAGVTSAVLTRETDGASGSTSWGCSAGGGRPLAGLVVLGLMLAPAVGGRVRRRVLAQGRRGAKG